MSYRDNNINNDAYGDLNRRTADMNLSSEGNKYVPPSRRSGSGAGGEEFSLPSSTTRMDGYGRGSDGGYRGGSSGQSRSGSGAGGYGRGGDSTGYSRGGDARGGDDSAVAS